MTSSQWVANFKSGFYVFLIALPLSLGIALASGFPPISGVFTAIIGGLVCSFFGSSPLTIKGPAAGMIVVVLAAVQELGQGDAQLGYRRALAVSFAAAVLQMIFAFTKIGKFGKLIPHSVVHGMLAAIGVIIFAKQVHILLGVGPYAKTPFTLLAEIPDSLNHEDPFIAILGLITVVGLFVFPKIKGLQKVPAALLNLMIVVPLGVYWHLAQPHQALFLGKLYDLGPAFLVNVPNNAFDSITFPDWSGLTVLAGWKHVVLFALVGSIESILTVSAVDSLDPKKRHSNLDRDLLSVALGNLCCSCVGGLPMISEIVRSKANIDNGAQDAGSNFLHGALLLIAIVMLSSLINLIPLSALAAMLVVTGFRLASPMEFLNAYRQGWQELTLFVTTLLVTLTFSLLEGVAVGIGVHLCFKWIERGRHHESHV